MGAKVIELNDGAMKVGSSAGILAQSPGFALVEGDSLVLGDEAEQQARLRPTSSYNKYWHELSMESLNHDNHIRHTADIAFAHLVHLAEIAGMGEEDSDVIFSVPGNFTNQQLAILLGLAKQSPLNPVGLVDSAVLSAIAAGSNSSIVYVDFQLHQVVLTQVHSNGVEASAKSAVQIPGVGIQNFINLLMQQATDLFIEQCRFNPQHNAEYEQLLYNQMPNWLHQYDETQTNLILELKTSDATHIAKMPREGLIASLSGRYKNIIQELNPLLTDSDTKIVLGERLAAMPGFISILPSGFEKVTLTDDALSRVCVENSEHIIRSNDDIHWVKTLPVAGMSKTREEPKLAQAQVPTHFLSGFEAISIEKLNQQQDSASITVIEGSVFVDSKESYLLNKEKVSGKSQLNLGDSLMLSTNDEAMTAIRVNHGQ